MSEQADDWHDEIAANIRAERARIGINQDDVVAAMQYLGFDKWHRPTLGNVERGQRRVQAVEILGLAHVFQISASVLMNVREP